MDGNLITNQLNLEQILWDLDITWSCAGNLPEFQKLFREVGRYRIQITGREALWILKEGGNLAGWQGKSCTVVLTEDEELAERLSKEKAAAVVFYEKSGRECFVHTDMVIQGFDELGIQFFDRILKRFLGVPWTILFTERTVVREICLEDLDELYELYQDEEVLRYVEPLYEREKEEAYTRDYQNYVYGYYGYGMWIVKEREGGRLIGRAGIEFRELEGYGGVLELGYIIGRDWRRKGYATEICEKIIAYAREELEAEWMVCQIHRENRASIRLAEKLGFVYMDSVAQGERKLCRYFMKL